jgi:endonuclease YncB( thermonuclease family)
VLVGLLASCSPPKPPATEPAAAVAVERLSIPTSDGTVVTIQGGTFSGTVVGIPDADDVLVSSGSFKVKVRLAEIDCPEWDQPYHAEAKALTSILALGKEVVVTHRQSHWNWKRIVGWVTLPDGTDLSRELLRRGAAWHYEAYSDHPQELEEIEEEAYRSNLGLWSSPNPIPPWEWRLGKRN